MTACASANKPVITSENWGSVDSKPVYLFTLTNSNGVTAKITNFGGIVVEFVVPDRNGQMDNIVLGLASLDDYLAGHPCFGSIVGRYANRISEAKFTLDGTEYKLAANSGKHHIHGGRENFEKKVWDSTISQDDHSATLSLSYLSVDGEEGYPGNLAVKVDYVLNNDNELQIRYTATSDKPTVLNLTNHSYFNLTNCRENILNHHVRIYADTYLPANSENIPTGEIVPVENTPYDLRQWTVFGDRMPDQLRIYDNNFCLKGTPDNIVLAAELYEPQSGRLLQTFTTEPGVQLYTGGSLNNRNSRNASTQGRILGVCFEAQHYPDSPNNPHFPSTVLRPGETYKQVTIYKVGIRQ
jgi:aldose 1-epimerase